MRKSFALTVLLLVCSIVTNAQLSSERKDAIDKLANETLAKTGVPSASIAVVKDGQIVARPMMTLSLAFDHRVTDGAQAAEFLRDLKQLIEQPYRYLV